MTLPTSTIINLFTSSSIEDRQLVKSYINEFTASKKWMTNIFDEFTINELAICGFGSKYPVNYSKTRNFIRSVQKDLAKENRDLVSMGLALVYDEGKELKEKCDSIHISYRTGGAYLLTVKLLGLMLLAKNEEFRQFIRTKTDVEGEKYYVPYNLNKGRTSPGKYVAIKETVEIK